MFVGPDGTNSQSRILDHGKEVFHSNLKFIVGKRDFGIRGVRKICRHVGQKDKVSVPSK